jgi:RHS repeat-associated protein
MCSKIQLSSLVRRVSVGIVLLCSASAWSQGAGNVVPPNGTHSQEVVDLSVQTSIGDVSWKRVFNGSGWRFNRNWDGINASFKPVLTQNTGGGTSSGGLSQTGESTALCWIWVDEDYTPGLPQAAATAPAPTRVGPNEYVPANNAYSQTAEPLDRVLSSFFANCARSGGNITGGNGQDLTEVFEGFRRQSQLYVGSGGRYVFKNRFLLTKQAVQKLPVSTGEPSSAAVPLTNLVNVANGWRWADRGGDWAEYDDSGRITRYGDKNNNTIYIQRNASGQISHIIDAAAAYASSAGRVVMTLHYTAPGGYLIQAKDYPQADNSLDTPARSVSYEYDALGRMTRTTDARGNVTQYAYDYRARLTQTTDPLSRSTTLSYDEENNSVKQMTAADGGISDFVFNYDDTKKTFYSKVQGPAGSAGRRTEEYTHDRAGDLVKYEVNGRTDLAITRDPAARTESRTNARGFTSVLTKNEFEQTTQVQYPDGAKRSTQYESRWLNPIEMTDELGIKMAYSYDVKGNVTKKVEAQGTSDERTTEYEINSAGWPTKITRKGRTETNGAVTPDVQWQLQYDAAGQIKQTTDPEGNIRQYVYSRLGQLVKYTDPLNRVTTYEVDAQGNLVKVTDALGQVRSYAYDANNNLSSVTDARGKAVQMAYDTMNRPSQITNPVGGQYKQLFNTQGQPASEADEDGRGKTFEYDSLLRLTKQTDALGNATQYTYQIPDGSQAGQLGTLVYPTKVAYPTFAQQTKYDARERPTSQTLINPNSQGTEGFVSSAVYDNRGQVINDTDANGKTRFYAYNGLGQLIETTDSLGYKTSAQYDTRGNLIQIEDAKGQTTKFEYDKNSRLSKETLPLGQSTQYAYDAVGNLIQKIDPNGKKAVFSFDALNRISETKQYDNANQLKRTTVYSWDASDNLISWSDQDATRPTGQQVSTATIAYDDASRKTNETITYPNPQGGTYSLSYAYTYSAAGLKTQLTWADGTVIDYSYSQHGELENVAIPGEGNISVNQFKWTAPAKVTLPGGTVQDRTFDGLLNLESLKVKTPGAQTVLSIANTYGKVQELKTNTRSDTANGQSSTKASTFQYDSETRLTQASTDAGGLFGTDTENFTLDAVGNRVAHSKVSGAWVYDTNNRLTQRGTGANATTYQYDDAGNLTQKTEPGNKITQYSYDTQNRLTQVQDGQARLVARYGYDPLNRRIWKEQYRDKTGAALSSAKRTYYLYADEGLITEAAQDISLDASNLVTSNNAPAITSQYGPTPNSDFGSDVLFIKTKNSNNQDSFAYYHHDQIGAPVQATDKAGNIVWAASYNAFGQASITTPAATVDKPTIESNLRLPGQYEDVETGLYYNFNRYYDPQIGRYITQDPISLQGGMNRFLYVNADPLNQTDPQGLYSAADLPSLPDWTVNGVAAFGDTLSWGLTSKFRNALDIGSVDKCSRAYSAGTAVAVVYSLAFGAAHFGRHASNVGAKQFFSDSRAYGTVQRVWRNAVGGYKGKYELHHWFTPQSAGGTSAGWNLVPVSAWLNRRMSDGGLLFNAFKAAFIGTNAAAAGAVPTAIVNSRSCECN